MYLVHEAVHGGGAAVDATTDAAVDAVDASVHRTKQAELILPLGLRLRHESAAAF